MAQVVAVHGIANEFFNAAVIAKNWEPAICGSLQLPGVDFHDPVAVDIAFYGDLFRKQGTMATGFPQRTVSDLSDYEGELLVEIWKEAAKTNSSVMPPDAETMLYVPDTIRRAFNALAHLRFLSGIVDHTAILWFVNQVYRYFHEPEIRAEAQRRVAATIDADTKVLVAHSLGSIVAYEALCAYPEWPVRALVTIGSPLGAPNLVFDRLNPAPTDGMGQWPAGLQQWTNVSATGDFVALERKLANRFGSRVVDVPVDNAKDAHDASKYLTAKETALAIRDGLLISDSVER
ncbi:MAG: hypothetical protein AAF703_11595 [Cyanobacteria bacterium P01_D01_bin.105]